MKISELNCFIRGGRIWEMEDVLVSSGSILQNV